MDFSSLAPQTEPGPWGTERQVWGSASNWLLQKFNCLKIDLVPWQSNELPVIGYIQVEAGPSRFRDAITGSSVKDALL